MRVYNLLPVLAVSLAATLASALPAFADATEKGPASAGEKALVELIQTGVLGTLCVILMLVVWYLYRRIEAQQTYMLSMAEKLAQMMTDNLITSKRQNDLMDKMLERTAEVIAFRKRGRE